MGLAKPLVPSALQATSLLSRATSNVTITCTFNGSIYSLISPSADAVTCESIMRDVAAAMNISSNERSVTSIVWSCLSTVFACTWVSLHPNIPHPDATDWHIRRHRFLMMLCGLIVPELIVLLALREWLGARTLVKRMKDKGISEFTMVHAHFMLMGGFMLYSADGALRVGVIEDCNELVHFIHNHYFTLPSAEEIRDKSKGDGLSKALVVGQCGWFILQLLSRCVYGLAITKVELVTLAFSTLNGVTYFLWWEKPLNVRYGLHVVPQEPKRDAQLEFPMKSIPMHSIHDWLEPCIYPPPYTQGDLYTTSTTSSEDKWRYTQDDLYTITQFLQTRTPIRWLLPSMDIDSEAGSHRRSQTSMLHIKVERKYRFVATHTATVIGMLFGAIHLVAWNFQFLTPYEWTSWRVFSIIITATPAALSLRATLGYYFAWRYRPGTYTPSSVNGPLPRLLRWVALPFSRLAMWVTLLLFPLYVISRCGLLIQSLVALRNLEPAEKSQVQWINLLPHL